MAILETNKGVGCTKS